VYACTYPSDTSFSQLAETAQRVFARGGTVHFAEDKPNTPDNIFENKGEIYQRLGYEPQVSLERGIAQLKAQREDNK